MHNNLHPTANPMHHACRPPAPPKGEKNCHHPHPPQVKVTLPPKNHNLLVLEDFPGWSPAGFFGRISVSWTGQWHPFAVISGNKV